MKPKRIKKLLDNWQIHINRQPYMPLMPYPHCCVCYDRLYAHNVTVEDDTLVDVCKTCKALEDGLASPIYHVNCDCAHCGPDAGFTMKEN